MEVLHDGPHSKVWRSWDEYAGEWDVHKRATAFLNFGVVPREAMWLGLLNEPLEVPHLFRVEDDCELVMEFVGAPVTKATLPKDWEKQAGWLLGALDWVNCRHNDIRPENLLVKNGLLYLIDFAWATTEGDPIPPHWPKELGGAFKKGVHDFDDRYSLYKSLESVANGSS